MSEVIIRKFEKADLEEVKRITLEAFAPVTYEANIESAFGRINGQDWRFRKALHIDDDIAVDADSIFVAVIEETVVGYITSRRNFETKIGSIPNLAVNSEYRGRGIGQKLLDHVDSYMREVGMEILKIETLEQNAIGQQLYPKMGFKEMARQIYYCKDLRE
jgi:ribosomal protein S18 acetylase RimI-like enzyme